MTSVPEAQVVQVVPAPKVEALTIAGVRLAFQSSAAPP